MSVKNDVWLTLKNLSGKHTPRKIVTFSVDDYGNQRIASLGAREAMRKAGMNVESNRFDKYDSLETEQDLLELYDVLTSVKDKNGYHAVFTPFSVSGNIDFERMEQEGFSTYRYELVKDTCERLGGDYAQVPALWKEGIGQGIFMPQFHGREHLNIKHLMEALRQKDPEVLTCFANRSLGALSRKYFPHIGYSAAFQFEQMAENEFLKTIIEDGLNTFEANYGYRARHFTAPGAREHRILHETLSIHGIEYIDTDLVKTEHQGEGVFRRRSYFFSPKNEWNQCFIIRNCVYEPLLRQEPDWIGYTLRQVERAFCLNKPANISTHRVNFCGGVEESNRRKGLAHLKQLLTAIVKRWPDVEFMSTVQMADVLYKKSNDAK